MDQWGDGWAVLEQAADLKQRGEAFALATVVWRQGPSSGKEGCRAIISPSGELHGWIGGACSEPVVVREAKQVISEGVPRLLLLGTSEQFGAAVPEGMAVMPISCESQGALEVYIEPVVPTPHLVVVGRSPMAHTLVEMARVVGWDSDLIDSPEWNADFSLEGLVGPQTMVVVATQGHGDEEAVQAAVTAHPGYVGLVASSKRGQAVLGYLVDRGVPADELDRVQVPAGMDLGPTSHREIAVGILAQLVQLRASGALSGATSSAQTDTSADSDISEAIDPVCGMTVIAGPSAHPLEHDGQTYYFCCTGCHGAFEKDPEAYLKAEAHT
jgi:xanthine dehydrogenase accessory factor